ncbi:MAG: hypothetical protein ACTH8Z_02135 [Psychrobacter sp.]|uniref:hypothetical protein n=1 Tax=unclassified Psychrobacter TaxID=196806 RepID=UPI0017883003|nr:hypothetical protein [Psychrobacter sp. FME5]MBE0444665.1 hypothetical protein [Psychrobacter sp. FME5]MDN5801399.1 hypothetical protein [Psychrobacter sp.]
MTNTTDAFEPKRIDDIHWSGGSKLPKSIQDKGQTKPKVPLFYLHNESINDYEEDIYFVNNSDETLSFVAPYELMKREPDCPEVIVAVEPSERDKAFTYTDVLPKQGVKIDRQHIIYDSDYLNQIIVYTMSCASKEMWGVWRLSVCEKGMFSSSYPLLWEEGSKPSFVVSADKLNDPKDRPILPPVLPIRQQLYQQWADHYDDSRASFMTAITDVIYRYDFGMVGCYFNHMWDEYSSEAEQTANRLIKDNADSVDDVLVLMTAVYDSSFGAGYTTVPKEVAEIIYGLWLRIGHKDTVNK